MCVSIDVQLFFVQVFACQKGKLAKTLPNIYTEWATMIWENRQLVTNEPVEFVK